MTSLSPRRFWKDATFEPTSDGAWTIRLDARPVRTPAGAALAVPSSALAEAIAAEWRAVEGEIRPQTMPLTRAANTSIDAVAPDPAPVAAAIAEYGASDLLCYRAEEPEGLRRRQFAAWDPLLAWAAEALDARLVAVMGVMHVEQPRDGLAALRRAVDALDPFRLTALSELVTLSGSLVLGLSVTRGAVDASTAWRICRLDEDWQEEQWGRDEEAHQMAESRRHAFLQAAHMMRLLDG